MTICTYDLLSEFHIKFQVGAWCFAPRQCGKIPLIQKQFSCHFWLNDSLCPDSLSHDLQSYIFCWVTLLRDFLHQYRIFLKNWFLYKCSFLKLLKLICHFVVHAHSLSVIFPIELTFCYRRSLNTG